MVPSTLLTAGTPALAAPAPAPALMPAPASIGRASLPPQFLEALDLIHAFSGSGDELRRAMLMADDLALSHPTSGLTEALQAEALSTWQIDQDGQPMDLRQQVLELCDTALRCNAQLELAHVAKGRVLLRASQNGEAEFEIRQALRIDPNSAGATFLRADLYRRTERFAEADRWYRKFITLTDNPARKSNGYGWLAMMYQGLAFANLDDNSRYVAQAIAAFEIQLELNPTAAWKNANFAIFLNNFGNDYDRAENYALRALRLMEFPMARYHLAAARFQRLGAITPRFENPALADAVQEITRGTQVELADAVRYQGFSLIIQNRLADLQKSLPASQQPFRSDQVRLQTAPTGMTANMAC